MTVSFTDSIVEENTLEWFKDLGYAIVFGGDIALGSILASLRNGLSMPKLIRGEARVNE